jgi:hypothetical protein
MVDYGSFGEIVKVIAVPALVALNSFFTWRANVAAGKAAVQGQTNALKLDEIHSTVNGNNDALTAQLQSKVQELADLLKAQLQSKVQELAELRLQKLMADAKGTITPVVIPVPIPAPPTDKPPGA